MLTEKVSDQSEGFEPFLQKIEVEMKIKIRLAVLRENFHERRKIKKMMSCSMSVARH